VIASHARDEAEWRESENERPRSNAEARRVWRELDWR